MDAFVRLAGDGDAKATHASEGEMFDAVVTVLPPPFPAGMLHIFEMTDARVRRPNFAVAMNRGVLAQIEHHVDNEAVTDDENDFTVMFFEHLVQKQTQTGAKVHQRLPIGVAVGRCVRFFGDPVVVVRDGLFGRNRAVIAVTVADFTDAVVENRPFIESGFQIIGRLSRTDKRATVEVVDGQELGRNPLGGRGRLFVSPFGQWRIADGRIIPVGHVRQRFAVTHKI